METTVAFHCEAPAHHGRDGGGPDKLTIHEGQWAYCSYDSRADGHEWRRTEGLTISMIRTTSVVRELAKPRGGR